MTQAARELILEYVEELGVDLSFQGLEDELADLDAYYEWIHVADGDAGCVALRRIDDETCEMKRLYVRPHARGTGLGRALAERAIAEARGRGYARLVLDTLPTMHAAIAMYETLGFRETDAYRYNPVPGTRYLVLELGS